MINSVETTSIVGNSRGDGSVQRNDRRFALRVVVGPLAALVVSVIAVAVIAALTDDNSSRAGFETGFMPFAALTLGGFAVFVALITAGVEQFPADRTRHEPWPLTIASATGAVAVVSACFGPSSTNWPMLPMSLLAGALVGSAVFVAMIRTRRELDLPASTLPAPTHALRRGTPVDRTAVWSGRVPQPGLSARSWLLIPTLVGAVVALMYLTNGLSAASALAGAFPLLLPLLTSGAKIAAQRVRVTVGPSGIIIRNGLTGRVAYAVGLDHIDSAWFTDAPKASLWTSYGKQSSSTRLSFLSRKGPALLVRLTDETDIVVALDRPEEAAGIVNDLIDRRAPAPPTMASR